MLRADLRLEDLRKEQPQCPSKLMNVKVPSTVRDAIDRVAQELGVTKTAVVVALLNEGLDAFEEKLPKLKKGTRGEVATVSPSAGQE